MLELIYLTLDFFQDPLYYFTASFVVFLITLICFKASSFSCNEHPDENLFPAIMAGALLGCMWPIPTVIFTLYLFNKFLTLIAITFTEILSTKNRS